MSNLACFLCVVLTLSALGQPAKDPPYKIPTPKGWGKEIIELPPSFAKNMNWKGTEELRFAPGMFKSDAADFLSYSLLFWLPDDQKIDPKTMEKVLLEYYRGLAKAVLESKKAKVDVSKFALTIDEAKEKPAKRTGGEEVNGYIAELKWIEPFATGKQQTLRMEIQTWHSDKHKHHCVFICASPQEETADVWKALRDIRTGCTTP
jgi:hypothetical protein